MGGKLRGGGFGGCRLGLLQVRRLGLLVAGRGVSE